MLYSSICIGDQGITSQPELVDVLVKSIKSPIVSLERRCLYGDTIVGDVKLKFVEIGHNITNFITTWNFIMVWTFIWAVDRQV